MKCAVFILIASFVLFSCEKKSDDNTPSTLSGSYAGIFHRSGMDTARVKLSFDAKSFEGETDHPNYPAICAGKYDMQGDAIDFTDTCTWTANFDWSLILDGRFQLQFSENELRLTRTSGNFTDEYVLTRLSR